MLLYSFFITILIIYLSVVFKRAKKYRYDTAKDYIYNMQTALQQKIIFDKNSISIPTEFNNLNTFFLKIRLKFNPISYFFKPYIEIDGLKHFFEYGAEGIRYLNISHIRSKQITLKCKNMTLNMNESTLYGYKNEIDLSKKILIFAPHADDAEIAAFGLYKSADDVTIVTTTIGEHGICNYCNIYKDRTKAALKKAELRTFDALCIPMLGGVDTTKSIALGYYGGSLQWMSEHPEKMATSHVQKFGDMNRFRRVSHCNINLPHQVKAEQNSFLNDLEQLFMQIKPDYIITPHPAIDSHPDHKYTTYALINTLKRTGLTCKLLTYTNHLSLSETYPVGDIHSSVTLPPNFNEFYFDGVYSFELDEDLQTDKFFALEAIHDLRDSLVSISIKKAYKQFNKMVKRALSGKDKSYFKRAVRANELFFVIESKDADKLL